MGRRYSWCKLDSSKALVVPIAFLIELQVSVWKELTAEGENADDVVRSAAIANERNIL